MPIEFRKGIPTSGQFPGAPTLIDLDMSANFPAIDPNRISSTWTTFVINLGNTRLIAPTYDDVGNYTVPGFYHWTVTSTECEAYCSIIGNNKTFTFFDIKMTPLNDTDPEIHSCLFGSFTLSQGVLRSCVIGPGYYVGSSLDTAEHVYSVGTNQITFSYNKNYPVPATETINFGFGYTQNIHDNRVGTPYIPFFAVSTTSQSVKPTLPTFDLRGTVAGTAGLNQDFSGEQTIGYQNLYYGLDVQRYIDDYNVLPDVVLDESEEVGPPSEPGGYVPGRPGAFDDTSDPIDIPDNPDIGVSNVGFVRVYNTGVNSLQRLGVELFPPLQYTAPTPISGSQSTTDAIVDGFNAMVTFFANIPSFFDQMTANTLINYVIDCHVIPVSPGSGTQEAIVIGSKTMSSYGGRIYNDYVDYSCGSISVGEYYGAFPDFLTGGKLYLPFVGFVPVRPEWFIGDTLSVDYKFNVIDGSFACYVRSGGKYVNNGGGSTIVGVYSGNACIHLPITGTSYAAMAAGLVGAGSGMFAGAASGNISAAATSAIAAANLHGDIAQSNSYNGSAAFLSCRYPFLLIERPVSNYARNYQHEVGIPSNIYARLGSLSGFAQMVNVHVDGISGATEAEKAEIKRLLAQGVIV